jgi:plastocyanin
VVVFYVIGGLTAVWAVVLAGLGITRHSFPSTGGAARLVMAISVTLVVGAIGSAIISGALEADEHGEEAAAAEEEEAAAAEEEAAAEEAAPPGGEELELSAEPSGDLAFDTTELEAEAGTVTLAMANPSPISHNVSIDGGGVDEEGETVGEGETSTVTAELDPGEYAFYCSVAGHREGGMEGALTVR